MHITPDDIKLIHDLGWALTPYALIIFMLVVMATSITIKKEVVNAA